MKCKTCGNEIEREWRKDKRTIRTKPLEYCSRSCANKRVFTEEQNKKKGRVREANSRWGGGKSLKIHRCIVCDKPIRESKHGYCQEHYFQSDEFRRAHSITIEKQKGRSKTNRVRRSKNEILFFSLCDKYFDNVRHNDPCFDGWDADVIIDDIKVAVLWNSAWHYKKITEAHSLEQVQNRDKLKIETIQRLGWRPYIIKDMGVHNPQFVREQFQIFLGDVVQ